MTKEGQRVTPV